MRLRKPGAVWRGRVLSRCEQPSAGGLRLRDLPTSCTHWRLKDRFGSSSQHCYAEICSYLKKVKHITTITTTLAPFHGASGARKPEEIMALSWLKCSVLLSSPEVLHVLKCPRARRLTSPTKLSPPTPRRLHSSTLIPLCGIGRMQRIISPRGLIGDTFFFLHSWSLPYS